MTEPVRVLLLELPQLLRGIFEHAIQFERDCELMTDTRRTLQMLREERGGSPDIVILGLSAAEDATLVPALFARWPAAQILTVTQSGDHAAVYELEPRSQTLAQVSPDEVVQKLREAVHRRRAPTQP